MSRESLGRQLKEKGLKITPQRLAIYEAVINHMNHPTAENIVQYIKDIHPNISVGTVYKVLDSLVENDLLKRVKNESGIMRYDAVISHHHHLYCSQSDIIKDYVDEELDSMIKDHFKKKGIKGFDIEEIVLQIRGNFVK
jgi:Fur family transcriptional regulator, peroxide stress response regulator